MFLTIAFTSNGLPATGLSPIIDGWDLDGNRVLTGASMSEVAGGFYTYEFTGYNFLENYIFRAYESTLNTGEQYVYLSNDSDSQNSQGIIKQILGLVQGNMVTKNGVYDAEGRLLTANIYSYPTANDANLDTNVEFSYAITATYDPSGNLKTYKCTEA